MQMKMVIQMAVILNQNAQLMIQMIVGLVVDQIILLMRMVKVA